MPIPQWLIRIITLGLEIERKTDVIALAAFLIALGGVAFQMTFYLRGPVVRLFQPDQVVLRKQGLPDGRDYITIIARMAYVNTGYVGYNGTLKHESVLLQIGQHTYEQVWQRFVKTDADGVKLTEETLSPAKPIPVNAGNSESHETVFVPRLVRCRQRNPDCNPNVNFLTWRDFLKQFKQPLTHLKLEFRGELYGKKSVKVVCYVDYHPSLRRELLDYDWAAPPCWETQ